jgi:hypothetical protein
VFRGHVPIPSGFRNMSPTPVLRIHWIGILWQDVFSCHCVRSEAIP